MQGIQSLMPGQAQQAPMPGMMPQQSSSTPASVVAQLNAQLSSNPEQRLQQLLQMYAQKPTLELLSQVSKATDAVELKKKQQQQDYMAAFAQQGPQTVADMVKQRAQQTAQQPVMAAQGGIMQGYAGGGAVAFEGGGRVQKFQYGAGPRGVMANPAILSSIDDIPIYRPSEGPEAGETEEQYRARKEREAAEADEVSNRPLRRLYRYLEGKIREPSPVAQMRNAVAPPAATETTGTRQGKSGIADLDIGPSMAPLSVAPPRSAPETGQSRPQQRPPAAPAAAAQADTGLAGLMGPMIEPERLAMRGAVDERQVAIRNAAKTPEDVLKARGGIDALMKEIVDSRRAEEQRLMTHSDKRLEEARARAAQSPLSDITFLGQMLEGMRGTKRFGDALAGAASGAGKAQTARSQALQAAEEKYDLSRRDIFNLANLRQQVQLDQAKLAEARATGDADRANKAALDLAQSKEALAKFEMDVSNKSREFGLEERKLTQQGQISREQMQSQERIAAANRAASAELRNLPGPEQQMIERAIKSLMDANPGMAYHEAYDKARGSGKGLEERAEFANLRQRAIMLQNELKGLLEADPTGRSPRIPELRSRLDAIYKELGGTPGVAPTGNASDPLGIRK